MTARDSRRYRPVPGQPASLRAIDTVRPGGRRTPKSYRYAAYGSNLHPQRLARRAPSATLLGTSVIAGYDLRFNKKSLLDGSAKCNVMSGDRSVHLAIFEIAIGDKAGLDACEGLGRGYNEEWIHAPGFGDCLVYVADAAAIDNTLRPVDWYRELVLLGCRFNGFPEAYVQAIEAMEVVRDADATRRDEQWKLVEYIRGASRGFRSTVVRGNG